MKELERLFRLVDESYGEALKLLGELVSISSVSARGEGLEDAAYLVRDFLRDVGLEARLLSEGAPPVVYGDSGGSEATLLFYNHYDVQPPEPLEEWRSNPFELTIRNGLAFGRGVADNKGCLVARIWAVKTILEGVGELPLRVKFFVEGEEEVGSPHIKHYVERYGELFRADGGLWETAYRNRRGQLLIYLGLKGIVYLELRVKSLKTDAHSSLAPLLPNAAWRLIHLLSKLRDEGGNILIPGFYDDVEPPTPQDLKLLEALDFDEKDLMTLFGVDRLLGGARGLDAARRLYMEPALTVDGMLAGYTGPGSKTVIPAEAMAKIDFRLVPRQRPERVIKLLKDYLVEIGYGDVEIIEHGLEPPARTPPDDPIVEATVTAAERVYGVRPAILPMMAGSGPMYYFTELLGIPMSSAGVGYYESKVHAPNENIRIEDFRLGIKHIIATIFQYASNIKRGAGGAAHDS